MTTTYEPRAAFATCALIALLLQLACFGDMTVSPQDPTGGDLLAINIVIAPETAAAVSDVEVLTPNRTIIATATGRGQYSTWWRLPEDAKGSVLIAYRALANTGDGEVEVAQSNSVAISVSPKLRVALRGPSQTVPADRPITFVASAEGGTPPYSIYWYASGERQIYSLNSGSVEITKIFKAPGQEEPITVKAVDGKGKVAEARYRVKVEDRPHHPAPREQPPAQTTVATTPPILPPSVNSPTLPPVEPFAVKVESMPEEHPAPADPTTETAIDHAAISAPEPKVDEDMAGLGVAEVPVTEAGLDEEAVQELEHISDEPGEPESPASEEVAESVEPPVPEIVHLSATAAKSTIRIQECEKAEVDFMAWVTWSDGRTEAVNAKWTPQTPLKIDAPGEYTVVAAYSGLTASASVLVSETPAEVRSLKIDPQTVSARPGEEISFKAIATTEFCGDEDVTGKAEWYPSPTFSAGQEGSYEVVAKFGKYTSQAIVEIVDDRTVVPDVTGLPLAEAQAMLGERGLHTRLIWGDAAPQPESFGSVQFQQPEAGSRVDAESPILLHVYSKPPQQTAPQAQPSLAQKERDTTDGRIPNIIRCTEQEAVEILKQAGYECVLHRLEQSPSALQSKRVYSQEPLPGKIAVKGTAVEVFVYGEHP